MGHEGEGEGSREGRLGYLQVLNAELVAVHVDGRQEDGLHLVVAQLVGGQVGSNENLEKHKAMSEKGASSCRQNRAAPSLKRQPARPVFCSTTNPLPSPDSFVCLLRLYRWQFPTEQGNSFNQVPSVHVI